MPRVPTHSTPPEATAPSPAPPTIVDGVALYERRPLRASDDRPPIVLVHGGMHGAWIWADVQEHLAHHGWHSIAFDWYSHGRSDALPVEQWVRRSLTEVAHEIAVACAAVDDGAAPAIIGHSMGGLATLAFAAARPPRLGPVALFSPIVPREFADEPIPVEGVDPHTPYGPFPPALARELFYDGLSEEQARRWVHQLQPESPTAVSESVCWTAEVDVSRITVPMLTFGAELDRLVPAAYVRALADATGAGYLHLPGTGHGIPVNPGWRRIVDIVTNWIEVVG